MAGVYQRLHREPAATSTSTTVVPAVPAALKAANGKFVSVEGDKTILKSLGNARPGDAESFQWVNLMRGDTMLMSLTNHRYLATQPNTPGPVTVTSLGASAARKSGAEFKWKALD